MLESLTSIVDLDAIKTAGSSFNIQSIQRQSDPVVLFCHQCPYAVEIRIVSMRISWTRHHHVTSNSNVVITAASWNMRSQ